jgi:hypothetical protein
MHDLIIKDFHQLIMEAYINNNIKIICYKRSLKIPYLQRFIIKTIF